MIVMVMDGQGGGIGAEIIKGIRQYYTAPDMYILALGTNSTATAQMMKNGANRGATGENAIIRTSGRTDVIIGPLSIIISNAMMGEVTPSMADAICSSRARKILIPMSQEDVYIVGVTGEPLPHMVAKAIKLLKEQ